MMEKPNIRDAAAGAIFFAIGAAFALAARNLELGTALRMGPGYFPLVLSFILMGIGAIIVFVSLATAPEQVGSVPWRGFVLVLLAPIVFGLTVRRLGLVPAMVITIILAIYASRRANIPLAGVLSLGLTLFCLAVFTYGLRLPIPLFAPWLRF
jgi:hypothetical protein